MLFRSRKKERMLSQRIIGVIGNARKPMLERGNMIRATGVLSWREKSQKHHESIADELDWTTDAIDPDMEKPPVVVKVTEEERETVLKKWGKTKSRLFLSLDPRLSFWKSTIDPIFLYTLPTGDERLYRMEMA